MTIHRQLGDKARTLTRTRDREGREEKDEELRGIHEGINIFSPSIVDVNLQIEHAANFDQEWMRAAGGTGIVGRNNNQTPAAIEYPVPACLFSHSHASSFYS